MEWSMRLIPTNKVSTDNAETMSSMVKLAGEIDFAEQMSGKIAHLSDLAARLRRAELGETLALEVLLPSQDQVADMLLRINPGQAIGVESIPARDVVLLCLCGFHLRIFGHQESLSQSHLERRAAVFDL